MHITDPTGSFRFEITMLGKEEFGVTNTNLGVKGYVFAESAADITIEFGAFYVVQERHNRKLPVLFLELHIDGILRNIVRPRTGRGLADGQFAESKIDRGLVLAADGSHIMKKFRFIDLDLDDAILESCIVGEAGSIDLKVVDAGIQPSTHDKEEYLNLSLQNRGAVSLLNGELNNTVGIRFDEGEKSVADSKYASLRQSTDCMLARRTWPLGKLIAQASFIYGSIDLVNSFRVVPQDHKYFNGKIAMVKRAIRHRYYIETDPKLIHKALFESDYTLEAKLREQIRCERQPHPANPGTTVVLLTENQNDEKSALAKYQVSRERPEEIRPSSAGSVKANTPPITPHKTPAHISEHHPLSPKMFVETPKVKLTADVDLLTPKSNPKVVPKAVGPIYISSDDEDDDDNDNVIFLHERKIMEN